MTTSQNGYVVLDDDTDGPQPHLRQWVIPGVTRKLLLRDGSCGFVLVHMALWFNAVIEKIDVGVDDWGWSPRRIAGTDLWSNHASGTAADLNADQHPAGVATSKTFSASEISKIRNRVEFYAVLRWGGDYRTTPDAMHYEIDDDLTVVVSRAQTLSRSPRGKRILSANPGVKALIFS